MGEKYETTISIEDKDVLTLLTATTDIYVFPRSRDNIFSSIIWKDKKNRIAESYNFNEQIVQKFEKSEKKYNDFEDNEIPFKKIEYNMFLYLQSNRLFQNKDGISEERTITAKKMTLFIKKDIGINSITRHIIDTNITDYFNGEYNTIIDDLDIEDQIIIRQKKDSINEDISFLYGNIEYEELTWSIPELFLDEKGMLEFEIITEKLCTNKDKIHIECLIWNTELNKEQFVSDVDIQLITNDNASSIDEIINTENIWIYPEDQTQEVNENEGIKRLQYLCNQVISRHKGIGSYNFIEEDGKFNANTKDALEKYIQNFPLIENDDNNYFPYSDNLNNIGPDSTLLYYLSNEYGLTTRHLNGKIVDKRLLIGDNSSSNLEDLDGLKDLYDNVVVNFQNQMVARAMEYVDNERSWFTNPGQNYHYRIGELSIQSDKTLIEEDSNQPIRDENDNLITIPSGTRVQPINDEVNQLFDPNQFYPRPGLYTITRSINGRVQRCRISLDRDDLDSRDDDIDQNRGDYTRNANSIYSHYGVPYTYGGKLPLDEFNEIPEISDTIYNWNRYELNDPAYPRTGDNSSRTYSWGKVYSGSPDDDLENYRIAGIDCAGLIRRCLEETFFDDTVTNIFPNELIHTETNYRARNSSHLARRIDTTKHLHVRKGDIIWSNTHVVIVHGNGNEDNELYNADENNEIDNNTFQVVHAYGGGSRNLQNTKGAFLGKTIRSPIGSRIWGPFNTKNVGRIYLWD